MARARADSDRLRDPPMPEPAHRIEDYTFERIAESRAFADFCIRERRNISPISKQYFELLRNACDTHMIASDNDFKDYDKFAIVSQIRKFETEIKERQWLAQAATPEQQEAVSELLLARKLQMYARYGDYLGHICHRLRTSAHHHQTKDSELLSGKRRWTSIADVIKTQLRERERRQDKPLTFGYEEDQDCPELRALEAAAEAAGIDPEQALFAVIGYGERNTLLHTSLEDDLQNPDYFVRLCRTLANDRADINAVIPIEHEKDRRMLLAIIDHLIARWCIIPEDSNNPSLWRQSEEYVETYITPAALREKRAKLAKDDKTGERNIREREHSHKIKAEKYKKEILDEIEGFLRGNAPGGMTQRSQSTPRELHQSREDLYRTLHSLSYRAGRRLRWSITRENQLQELQQESERLRNRLTKLQQLTKRYHEQRDKWKTKAISLQKEARKIGTRYTDAGWFSPPPTHRSDSPATSEATAQSLRMAIRNVSGTMQVSRRSGSPEKSPAPVFTTATYETERTYHDGEREKADRRRRTGDWARGSGRR